MVEKISERRMHLVRCLLTIAWLSLIASLFCDPITPWLTQPDNAWSPFKVHPELCILVQKICVQQQPYAMGAAIFWGMVVPGAIFILLVFGHELWRRICPLSFLSQLPRALGIQRQLRRVDRKTGKVRYDLARVRKDSWLGQHHFYLQFGLFYLGLCGRLLFFNADRLILSLFLVATIASAIAVGYWYGGKSWCHYFCPMAPIQRIYAEPRGLLTSKAHTSKQPITQSMCRTVTPEGKEQSACVACQTPCLDIDAERSYWDTILQPEQRVLYYGYVGLVVGYFSYYFLYAGNWDYYLSGVWATETDQLAQLFKPGFYAFDRPIPIPKLVAVPLTLALSSLLSYGLGIKLEKAFRTFQSRRTHHSLSKVQLRHQFFTGCTFFVFNFFFIFGGRPFLRLLPNAIETLIHLTIVCLSTLWLCRTWKQSAERYTRENLESRLRRQISKVAT